MKVVALDRAYWPPGWFGHWCPGCNSGHEINTIEQNSSGAKWEFDGNLESPTFKPSVNIKWGNRVPGHEADPWGAQCHYIIAGGMIQFCGDCTHGLVGQTVPLPDLPGDCYLTSQLAQTSLQSLGAAMTKRK